MKKKVLVIGPNFYNFSKAVKHAFEQCGYDVRLEMYDTPIHPYTTSMKWKYKLSSNKELLKQKSRKKYQTYIEHFFDNYKPEIVFILNGDILSHETLDYFRKTSKVVIWFFDSITRYPSLINHIDHADYTFCYEKTDVDYYSNQNKKAYFLPQACDTTIYKILKNRDINKDIDILFVGDLYNSKKRQQYINTVVKEFSNKKIKIFGVYKPWYKNFWKWLFREKRTIYANHSIPTHQVNDYYNRSKVVLNIHHEQQVYGANPKVYEISGSGAYQICDTNPYLEKIYPNNEISFYKDEKELIDTIHNVLKNDTWKYSEAAYEIVHSNHTYENRIKYVLEIINN